VKKIFVLTLILLVAFMVPAFAEEKNDEATAAQKVIDSIKDIRYAVKAGTNITNYRDLVQKAGIEYERFADKYPQSGIKPSAAWIIGIHKDAYRVWHNGIFSKYGVVFSDDPILVRYPAIKNMIKPVSGAKWYSYSDVLQALWTLAIKAEQDMLKPKESTQ